MIALDDHVHIHVMDNFTKPRSTLEDPLFLALLGRYVDLAQFKPFRTDSGKPMLLEETRMHLSIAHSGNILAVGFSRHPIGIDVELIKERKQQLKIAQKYGFSSNSLESFYQEWTAREAFIKLKGGTLGKDLASIKVKKVETRLLIGQESLTHECVFRRHAGYLLAVCFSVKQKLGSIEYFSS